MASLNKVQLIGNLGADPELRYTPRGIPVVTISLATTDTWKDRDSGDKKEATEWHRVVFFKGLAEVVNEYLRKGRSVYVEGKLRTRKWTDNGGVDHYSTEIVAQEMQMLGKAPDAATGAPQPPAAVAVPPAGGFDDMDDDVPF